MGASCLEKQNTEVCFSGINRRLHTQTIGIRYAGTHNSEFFQINLQKTVFLHRYTDRRNGG